MRKITAGAAALLLTALLALGLVTTRAEATETTDKVCGTWVMRGATGAYPDVTFGPSPTGSLIAPSLARLVKPATGIAPGVEFAAGNLRLTLTEPTVVTARFELSGGASTAAGAVRMFAYREQQADTLNDAPAFSTAADGGQGELALVITPGTLGTLGFAYDASNDARGAVTVLDLKVGDRPVRFTRCATSIPRPTMTASEVVPTRTTGPQPTSTSPSRPPTRPTTPETATPTTWRPTPDLTPTGPAPTQTPDEEATPTAPAPVPSTSREPVAASLPLTGPGTGLYVAGLGAGALLLGIGVTAIVRRRKLNFRA